MCQARSSFHRRSCYALCLSTLICIAFVLAAGRWSDQALAQDVRSSTTIGLSSSTAVRSVAGQPVTFAVNVASSGGVPTGLVIFKDGPETLGTVKLSDDGTATFTTSALALGSHAITAHYVGDGRFAGTATSIFTHLVRPAGSSPAGPILLVVIILIATLFFFQRVAFLLVGRIMRSLQRIAVRTIRTLPRQVARLLRSLRIISRVASDAQSTAAVQSAVGLSTAASALSGETEAAIHRNLDIASIQIVRHKKLFCTSLAPQAMPHVIYERRQAELTLNSAKNFFSADVPLDSNPLNLYDDIDGAFIVNLLGDIDKAFFYVLSEFKKAITGNVIALATLFSVIVSVIALANILFSTSIDFYPYLGLAGHLPYELNLGIATLELSKDSFNKAIFGISSCMFGYLLMWLFHETGYAQFQRHNGLHMNSFIVQYLANINNGFRQMHTNATRTIVEEKGIDEMKHDASLWITQLQWMAFRTFFIEQFLKNVLFQIRRDGGYYIVIIPILFVLVLLGAGHALGFNQLNVFDPNSEVYRQNTFYLFFAWLVFAYYRYLRGSISVVWQSIESRRWFKFRELNLQEAMTAIVDSYVVQLDRWRSMMKSRG
jgi:hypothetical protein